MDITEYFKRIGFEDSSADASLQTLQAIHLLHPQAIAFENLSPFTGLPVQLDLESVWQKLVRSGRGGFCFEHNLLLMHVLKQIGFKVKGLAARVRWNAPADRITPRGHMLLLVEVQEQHYIADVGFGGLTLTAPLQLVADVAQPTSHEDFRLLKNDDEWELQALVRNEWQPLYRFSLQEQLLPDYEVTSWYLCNHSGSHFRNGLIAARVAPAVRYALRNTDFAVHHLHKGTDRQTITTVIELRSLLENIFGLRFTDIPALDARLEEILEKAQEASANQT
jgi:N-hydroxyarylamine O-acetyltransferase